MALCTVYSDADCWCLEIRLQSRGWHCQASPVSMLCKDCFPSPLIGEYRADQPIAGYEKRIQQGFRSQSGVPKEIREIERRRCGEQRKSRRIRQEVAMREQA